ncbi:hypothetical protein QUF90_22735 [Desulfococcaceae bacterium HSG9]|nr:hypothetical protein [Desulfococcaceae bacterium HSG9]
MKNSILLILAAFCLFNYSNAYSEDISDKQNSAFRDIFINYQNVFESYQTIVNSENLVSNNSEKISETITPLEKKRKRHFDDYMAWKDKNAMRAGIEMTFSIKYRNLINTIFKKFEYKGMNALNSGSYPEALNSFESVLLIKPDHREVRERINQTHFQWATALFDTGKDSDAYKKLKQFRKTCRKDCDQYISGATKRYFEMGRDFYRQGVAESDKTKISGADRIFRWLKAIDPNYEKDEIDNISVHLKKISARGFNENQFKMELEKAIDFFLSGNKQKAAEKLKKARLLKNCTKCQRVIKSEQKLYFDQGVQTFKNKKFKTTMEFMELAEWIDPESAADDIKQYKTLAQYMLNGLDLFKKNLYAQSISEFQKAMRLNPLNEISHKQMADDYIEKANHILFDKHYTQALLSYNNIQITAYAFEEYLKVKKDFEAALDYKKNDSQCQDYLNNLKKDFSSYHYKQGRKFFADEALDKALEQFKLIQSVQPSYKDIDKYIKVINKQLKSD